jgi:hypothetical protein
MSERDFQFLNVVLGCGASVSGGDQAVEDSFGVKEVRRDPNLVRVVRYRSIEQSASLPGVQGAVEQTAARRTWFLNHEASPGFSSELRRRFETKSSKR